MVFRSKDLGAEYVFSFYLSCLGFVDLFEFTAWCFLWKIISPFLFKHCFCSILSSLLMGLQLVSYILDLFTLSHMADILISILSILFFFLCLILFIYNPFFCFCTFFLMIMYCMPFQMPKYHWVGTIDTCESSNSQHFRVPKYMSHKVCLSRDNAGVCLCTRMCVVAKTCTG